MTHTDNLLHYFLMTEGWSITALVLLYVIWMYTLPKARSILRIGVPLVMSIAAHLLMRGMGHHVEWARCISDMAYDWVAPIGIYHIGIEVIRRVRRRLSTRRK